MMTTGFTEMVAKHGYMKTVPKLITFISVLQEISNMLYIPIQNKLQLKS